MLKDELQSYFDKVYSGSKIDTPHSIGGDVHIRFELGGNLGNGTIQRVQQATERATAIFNDTFPNTNALIYVLIYDYDKSHDEYLYEQFAKEQFARFYNQAQTINNNYLVDDETRLIIGKLPVAAIYIHNILNGIANAEMGFDPCINQSIYFFEPTTDRGFYMYDDRGCYVWSNNADKIRDIYIKRNDWITEYHRAEIDAYFL